MTSREDAIAALELQREEKQSEIEALIAKLQEEQEDLANLDTTMEGLHNMTSDVHVTVPVPEVNVNVPETIVNVPETVVNVQVPEQPAPVVNVETAQPVVNVEPAQITITAETPDVTVNPNISVSLPDGSITAEITADGIAEAIAASNAMLLERLEEVRQQLRTVARAANVNVPGLLS